jgi:serine protease Do
LRRAEGAVITQVEPGLPADRAGVRRGDIVTAVNGLPLRSAAQLRNRIGLTRVGESLTLSIDRNGQPVTATAVVAEGPRPPVEQRRERRRAS